MLISVVICTYNGEKYLEEQLLSIMNQSYQNIEIIISDDGSKDDTLKVARKLQEEDTRISIYQNDVNLGFNKNFEQAFEYCKGELIALSDQDDIWNLDKLQRQYKVLIKDNASLVYSNSQLVDTDGKDLNKDLFTQLHVNPIDGDTQLGFLFDNCIAGHTILFRRSLLKKIYPIPTSIFFDRWIGFTASFEGVLSVIKESLVFYRQHSTNVTDVLREKKQKKTRQVKLEKRKKSFKVKVNQFESFLEFFESNNIKNENTKVIDELYNELKNYKNYFFNFKLFMIYLKNKDKIFQIKDNKFAAMLKFSCGLKMYKIFPFL